MKKILSLLLLISGISLEGMKHSFSSLYDYDQSIYHPDYTKQLVKDMLLDVKIVTDIEDLPKDDLQVQELIEQMYQTTRTNPLLSRNIINALDIDNKTLDLTTKIPVILNLNFNRVYVQYTILITPLMVAIDKELFWAIRDLLDYAEKNKQNIIDQAVEGFTPLMIAAEAGELNLIKDLLDRRANRNIFSKKGKRAVDFATPEIVKILKTYGKNYFNTSINIDKIRSSYQDLLIEFCPNKDNKN